MMSPPSASQLGDDAATRRLVQNALQVLGGFTSALADHRDIDAALHTALRDCFDASGVSWGLLLLREGSSWRHHGVGQRDELAQSLGVSGDELAARLGLTPDLDAPRRLRVGELLATDASEPALLTPIVHRDQLLGALVLATGQAIDEPHVAFAGVVAGQVALVLTLAHSFRELEDATRAKHARVNLLESILNTITDPIIVFDQSSRPSHWNKAARALAQSHLSVPAQEWPRRLGFHRADQSTLYRPEELPVVRALGGEKVEDEEVFVRDESPSGRWLSVTTRPVRSGRQLDGAVMVVRDITNSRQIRARQIASDRMASIGVLAAGVVHEINNPLTALIAELDMATEDAPPGHPILDNLQSARDAAERVRLIVRDLKTISRGDSDEVAPVNLHHAIDTAVRMAVPQTRFCAVVECQFASIPRVLANEARLVQVFLNLLVNAAQAIGQGNPQAQRIRIYTSLTPQREVQVAVSDTGPGMTPEVRARLFTPFFTTKPVGMGTGLGLSICHRIVTSFGGTLDCETEVGRGTTFRLRFPPYSSAQMRAVAGRKALD